MAAPADLAVTAPPPAAAPDHVVVRDHRPTIRGLLRAAWRDRALIPVIGIRVIIKGYAGTKLGRTWLILRPVLSVFAMALLFGAVLDAPSNGVPYVLFLLVGMIAWLSFERFVFWGTRSFDVYRRLAYNLDFPLLLVPTSSAVPASIDVTVLSALALATAATDGVQYLQLGPELGLAVAGFALCLGLAWGLGLWLSALNAKARDVRIVLRYVMMIWLYVTPVIYPVSSLPESWRFLATINPVAAPVELVKEGVLGAGSVELAPILVSVGACLVLCTSGLWFFTRLTPGLLKHGFPDDDEDEELV
jgi:lipopolysaccharide transport system permease protein